MRYIIFVLFFAILSASCVGRRSSNAAATTQQSASAAPTYGYTVKRVFPHNSSSYTQGLVWSDGQMYEGTGIYGSSELMITNLETGNKKTHISLEPKYFGEGIALLNGKIYQLTWQEGALLIYDNATLEKLREIRYSGEGWGLATDGTYIYMSDGSDKITVRDPETFEIIRTIEARLNGNRARGLNEMEWIEGELWANVYLSDAIVRIDPQTGTVTGVVDLEGLLPESERTPSTDVLNGIAYDSVGKRILVTGKNWSKLFEIELIKR